LSSKLEALLELQKIYKEKAELSMAEGQKKNWEEEIEQVRKAIPPPFWRPCFSSPACRWLISPTCAGKRRTSSRC